MNPSSGYTFLGMDRQPGGMYNDPPYAQQVQPAVRDLPFQTWWPTYLKAMYIIARTIQVQDQTTLRAVKMFYYMLCKLIPDSFTRQYLEDFFNMKPYCVDLLKETSPTLFMIQPQLESYLRSQPGDFYEMAMKNMDGQSLLLYVYLLHVFVKGIMASHGVNVHLPTLNDVRAQYQPDKISKYEWGNAIWYILHTSSLYAPEPIKDSFSYFKTFLWSLQYLLPCPLCRNHLMQNLKFIDLETCPVNREALFKCSWQLHNIVNKSEKKPVLSLQEAFSLYT
jgi:hypothetical protein